MKRDDHSDEEGAAGSRASGRQPQHPGQPARYTGRPGERDPGAPAREGKADGVERKGSDSRDARTSTSLAGTRDEGQTDDEAVTDSKRATPQPIPETEEVRARRRAVLGRGGR
jgi:hypothetical protein